jgi:exonuclease III
MDNNFKLLTWNIRNLNGKKEDRAIECIKKICKNFDIIAIQEVKDDLGGLEKLQKALGIKYRFLFSDTAGNSERLAFVYDSTKVQFTGLAAEVVMTPGSGKDTVKPELEFDRTPYMASFRVNGCNFIIVTVHIYYGSGSAVKYRLQEIKNIAKYLKKSSADTDALDSDYIACGDFNIAQVKEEMSKGKKDENKGVLKQLFGALQSNGLIIEKDIQNSPSNLTRTKHFDQIGYHKYKDSTIKFVKGGVIDFIGAVYVGDSKLKYKLTDHLPMWAVFSTSKDKNPKYLNP